MFSNSKRTLFLLIGIQASGKTTFAHSQLSEYEYISLDQLNTRNNEQKALENALQTGSSCVVDNTNPTKGERKKYLDLVKVNGYRVIGLYFRSAIEECSQRNPNVPERPKCP